MSAIVGQEPLALQAVGVELVRRDVRRRDDRPRPWRTAPPSRRPRIIASAMLVTWNSSKHSSQASAAICAASAAIGCSAARGPSCCCLVQAVVDLEHEGVEMDPPLALHRRRGEEQVHQHRLAAADAAEDVEAVRRGVRNPGEAEPRPPAAAVGAGVVALEGAVQAFELLGRQRLDGVGLEPPLGEPCPVGGKRPLGRIRRSWRAGVKRTRPRCKERHGPPP